MALIPNTKKPILYLMHTDSIMGPTLGIADAFGNTPPVAGGASNPNVDYIFLYLPQCEWDQTWEQHIMLKHRKVTGPDGYQSDDAAYQVQEDDEVVYIGEEDVDEVEEGEGEQDGVEEPATSTRKRKTQTEKAPAKKTQTDKPPAKKAPTRKKPRNMPKPLTPIKKPPSKKRS